MSTRIRDDVRQAAAALLDALRGVPWWRGEPPEERRRWWIEEACESCDGDWHPDADCPGCDVETARAMVARAEEIKRSSYWRARELYDRYKLELDRVAPGIEERLVSARLLPLTVQEELVDMLSEIVHGPGDGAAGVFREDGSLDPKALAILKALERPAGWLAEVAERTSSPVVSLSTTKKLSRALQDAGLVLRNSDGTWTRTVEGARAADRGDA